MRRIIGVIKNRLNPELEVRGILISMTDGRTKLAREVEESARRHFPDLVLKATIRENIRVAECPSHFIPLKNYAPSSPAVNDYLKLAEEIINQEEEITKKQQQKSLESMIENEDINNQQSLQETA